MKTLLQLSLIVVLPALMLTACYKNNPVEPEEPVVVAWAVGSMDTAGTGMILYSSDAGDTWVRQGDSVLLQGVDLNNVAAINQLKAWVVGSGNHIFHTNDGGKTWLTVTPPVIGSQPNLSGISADPDNGIWISGSGGVVYHTTDEGVTWTVFDTNFFRKALLQGIHAVTSRIVYVAGELVSGPGYGYIARTLNGGQSWDSIVLPNGFNQHNWIGVSAADVNNVVVYGATGHYAITDNAGASWKTPAAISPSDINCMVMLSRLSMWGACDYDVIAKTFNAGGSWVIQPSAGAQGYFLTGIDVYYSQTALIVGMSPSSVAGKILKTVDGGNTWSLKHNCSSQLWKVAFAQDQSQ